MRTANRGKVAQMAGARISGAAASLALGAALVLLSACDGRITQCNQLIRVINAEQEPIKRASGSDPEALKKLADALENVGNKVGNVTVDDEKIIGFRDKYSTMAKELATASRDTATAIEANDPKTATAAADHMTSFGNRESELVGEINGYCSGKP
jgi:hypothetical protein